VSAPCQSSVSPRAIYQEKVTSLTGEKKRKKDKEEPKEEHPKIRRIQPKKIMQFKDSCNKEVLCKMRSKKNLLTSICNHSLMP